MNFFIKTNVVDTIHILELVGKLTIGASSRAFRQAVDTQVDSGAVHIVVNFSQLTFMDSAGIGELIACNTRLRQSGVGLMLCELPKKVRDLFQITEVGRLFSVFEAEAQALESARHSLNESPVDLE